MANYGNCIDWVLKIEDRTLRGAIVDLHDGAGLTRFGLTQKSCMFDLPVGYFTTMDRDTALEWAKNVYHERYWVPIQGLQIPDDELAATLLSFVVNDGVEDGVKLIQRVVNVPDANVDGAFGPGTLKAVLQACQDRGAANVAQGLREAQEARYLSIIQRKPEDIRFKDGWLKRARVVYPELPY